MTIKICVKCSDGFMASLIDATGAMIGEYAGYVPSWMPGEHYGDYVELDIDPKNGHILNWGNPPTKKQLEETFDCKIKTMPK